MWKKNLNKSETKNFVHPCFYKMKTKTRKRLSSRGKILKLYKRNLMLAHAAYHQQLLLATPWSFLLQFSNIFQMMIFIHCEFESRISLKGCRFLKLSSNDHPLPLSFDYKKQNCHLLAHSILNETLQELSFPSSIKAFSPLVYAYVHVKVLRKAWFNRLDKGTSFGLFWFCNRFLPDEICIS